MKELTWETLAQRIEMMTPEQRKKPARMVEHLGDDIRIARRLTMQHFPSAAIIPTGINARWLECFDEGDLYLE